MTPILIVKLLTENTIEFPLRRSTGCPRTGDIVVFSTAMGDRKIHAKVNKIRWFLDEGILRIHALELKPEERDL
jgi:hypothetical protein